MFFYPKVCFFYHESEWGVNNTLALNCILWRCCLFDASCSDGGYIGGKVFFGIAQNWFRRLKSMIVGGKAGL
jgi:hypothetical protein